MLFCYVNSFNILISKYIFEINIYMRYNKNKNKMGCDCTKEDSRTKTLTENDEGNKINNADNKVNNKMVINANKKK